MLATARTGHPTGNRRHWIGFAVLPRDKGRDSASCTASFRIAAVGAFSSPRVLGPHQTRACRQKCAILRLGAVMAMKWYAAHAIVISVISMSWHRLFQDDLPSVSISRLRAAGVVPAIRSWSRLFSARETTVSDARSRLFTNAFPTAANGRFSCALFAIALRVFSSCTTGQCRGAAAFAMGLDIAYPAARPLSATSRGWCAFISCESCSTAGR